MMWFFLTVWPFEWHTLLLVAELPEKLSCWVIVRSSGREAGPTARCAPRWELLCNTYFSLFFYGGKNHKERNIDVKGQGWHRYFDELTCWFFFFNSSFGEVGIPTTRTGWPLGPPGCPSGPLCFFHPEPRQQTLSDPLPHFPLQMWNNLARDFNKEGRFVEVLFV